MIVDIQTELERIESRTRSINDELNTFQAKTSQTSEDVNQFFVKPSRAIILIPGLGGSMMKASSNGEEKTVWVRATYADHALREHMWGRYEPTTQSVRPRRDSEWTLFIPQDEFGLYSIDVLAPQWLTHAHLTYYFHDLIQKLEELGFKKGETMFGFPYDWRQSIVYEKHLNDLEKLIQSVYENTNAKVKILFECDSYIKKKKKKEKFNHPFHFLFIYIYFFNFFYCLLMNRNKKKG